MADAHKSKSLSLLFTKFHPRCGVIATVVADFELALTIAALAQGRVPGGPLVAIDGPNDERLSNLAQRLNPIFSGNTHFDSSTSSDGRSVEDLNASETRRNCGRPNIEAKTIRDG
jgi:hypothetical protein